MVSSSLGPLSRDDPDMLIPGATSLGRGRKRLTVLTLLDEMIEEKQRQQPLIDEAEYRERIVFGEQWRGKDPSIERVLATVFADETLVQENLTYPLTLTWAARVNEDRINPRAFPFQPTPGDAASAQAGNRILDEHRQRFNEDVLIAKAAVLAECHGDVLFLPMWDPADGPKLVRQPVVDAAGPQIDMQTGEPVTKLEWVWGGISEEVVAAPDYWTSGEDEYDASQWLCVRRVINRHLASAKLQAAGFFDKPPKEQDFPTAMDASRRGVESFEMWLKPGPRTKLGAFAVVIDRRAISVQAWPLKDKTKLPGAVWKLGHIRGLPRGKTHVSDAIHQQRLLNRALRAILKRAEAAEAADLFAPSSIIDALKDNRFHRVRNDDKGTKENTFWHEGPQIPQTLFTAYQNARRALYDVFGVSEATNTGGDPTETASGAQLRTATALDAQKIAPARRSLEQARMIVAKQILELWQTKVDRPTLVRVLGADGSVWADYFTGADLMGCDVSLEVRSGTYTSHLGNQVTAEQQGAAGQISPQAAVERSDTGLTSTVADAQAQARVDQQAAAVLRGQPQQPMMDVDPNMAIQRIHLAIGAAVLRGPTNVQGAQQLINAYQQAAQQAVQAQQQQAQAQPQSGQNGPGRSTQSSASQAKSQMQATKIRDQQLQQEVQQ